MNIKKLTFVSLLCNLFLGIFKLIVGIYSNSISIISDSGNNLLDVISIILSIYSIYLCSNSKDNMHPFGYGRYDYITSYTMNIFIIVLSILFMCKSIVCIISSSDLLINSYVFIVLIISIVIKFILYKLYIKYSFKYGIESLKGNAYEYLNDLLVSICLLVSMIFMYYFNDNIDGYLGLIISIYIVCSSLSRLRSNISLLLGKRNINIENIVINELNNYDIVINSIFVHDYGFNNYYVLVNIDNIDLDIFNLKDIFLKKGIYINFEMI